MSGKASIDISKFSEGKFELPPFFSNADKKTVEETVKNWSQEEIDRFAARFPHKCKFTEIPTSPPPTSKTTEEKK